MAASPPGCVEFLKEYNLANDQFAKEILKNNNEVVLGKRAATLRVKIDEPTWTAKAVTIAFHKVMTLQELRTLIEERFGAVRLKSDEPLHQSFYRSTYKSDILKRIADGKAAHKRISGYQSMIRQANRFVLTNDTLEEVYHLSHQVDKLYDRSALARIPFDTVFIEYDGHHKVRVGREHGTVIKDMDYDDYTDIPRKSGFLLKQLYPDRPDAWVAFTVHSDQVVGGLTPLGFLFDAQSTEVMQERLGWKNITQTYLKKLPAFMNEDAHDALQEYSWGVFGPKETKPPGWDALTKMSAYIEEPLWALHFEKYSSRTEIESQAKVLADVMREHAGDLRFLVSLLAVMNEVPIILNPVESRGSFMAGGKMQPFFSHRTVGIDLPARYRKQRRTKIAKLIAAAVKSRKRRHQVRGHMRRYYDKNKTLKKEVWINSHARGDATLGWVHQDWEVRSKHVPSH